MKTVIFPGTFDPPNLGHLDIIQRAANLFDLVYVAIGLNSQKPASVFSVEQRLEFLEQITENISNVEVVYFEGLLVDYVKDRSISTILRTIRSVSDFEFEMTLAHMNRKISGIETLFMNPDEKYLFISSTLIRDLARNGKRLKDFVPERIEPGVFNHLSELAIDEGTKE